MEIAELRHRFLTHFALKGYIEQAASAVIPENDPSVLFTTAGMQQFKDYYTEPSAAPHAKLATVQPVIRTSDIAEVGDDTHLTMFEMLGIFSFGQTDVLKMKKDAIESMWQFIHHELGVAKNRVHATIFAGDDQTARDEQSAGIWRELGVPTKPLGREDNFWGPTGLAGPCGPTSEVFIDGIEVGNLVFNQYYQAADKTLTPLAECGLDFGSGLERLSATLLGKDSVWQIAPFTDWVSALDKEKIHESRVIIDHLKAAIFLISAGVMPGNKGRDYVLRRLIRKAVFLSRQLSAPLDWQLLVARIRELYLSSYQLADCTEILDIFVKEKEQFEKNLSRATAYLERWMGTQKQPSQQAVTDLAFYLYESFGFPKELVIEYLVGEGYSIDRGYFDQRFASHQEVSRAGLEKQFKGGLADHNEQTIKHHTAHHLLLAALRQVLGPTVVQRGSNVTSERLRLDFAFDRKLTEHELQEVGQIVNEKIAEDLPVTRQELPKDVALQSGALAEFGQKYGDTVSVYTIGDFSKELCGGPHIARTGQLGRFEILKEEASSQGVRRIKARVE